MCNQLITAFFSFRYTDHAPGQPVISHSIPFTDPARLRQWERSMPHVLTLILLCFCTPLLGCKDTATNAEPTHIDSSVTNRDALVGADTTNTSPPDSTIGLDATIDQSTGRLDFGSNEPQPNFSNETPLTTAQSGLELRTADLENSADPTQWLRFVGRRLTPPVPELNDTTPIQPWFVYRPENSPTWRWLILGILLPDGRPRNSRNLKERLFIQRTGPWHTGTNESRRVVEAGTRVNAIVE